MPLKNKGNHMQLNTLTAARKALTLDDLRLINDMTKFLETMITEHPQEVVDHFFTPWMRTTCAEVDDGTRPLGSSTAAMLEFYGMMAEGLRARLTQAQP